MSALQKKYFGKGHSSPKRTKKTKVKYLAKGKKKSSKKGGGGFLGGFGLGNIKSIIAPLVGGAGDRFLADRIPVRGVGAIVAGMLLKDTTTRQIGFYNLGYSGADMFLGGTTTQGGLL